MVDSDVLIPKGYGAVDLAVSSVLLPPKRIETTLGEPATAKFPTKRGFHHSTRGTSLNLFAIVGEILLVPPVFSYVVTLLTFKWHYSYPRFVWILVSLGALPILITYSLRKNAVYKGLSARWYNLSLVLFTTAFVSGCLFGNLNYWYYSHTFYTVSSMKSYSNINPTESNGVRLMDAGKIYFSDNARLESAMGMSFTTLDTYCVAPIIDNTPNSSLASYDLWAVGMNCCSASNPYFGCGEYNNPHARAGVRQTFEEQRLYFRLAVQQAEAAYNIEAKNPIFFYWVQDPDYEVSKLFHMGYKYWVLMQGMHFAVNTFLLICFLLLFNAPHRSTAGVITLG